MGEINIILGLGGHGNLISHCFWFEDDMALVADYRCRQQSLGECLTPNPST